jgi:hypothetical protein
MDKKTYMSVSAAVFALVALVHLLRVINGWYIYIGGWVVPPLLSYIAIVIAAALAYTGFSKR